MHYRQSFSRLMSISFLSLKLDEKHKLFENEFKEELTADYNNQQREIRILFRWKMKEKRFFSSLKSHQSEYTKRRNV